MRKYLLALAFLLAASQAHATTYYVDNCVTVGNDTNNGTASGTPWLTLAHVSATVADGDVVNFRSGCIWREQRTDSKNITIQAYGSGTKPSFRGSNTFNVAGNWTNKSGNLWYASGITTDPAFVIHNDNQCTQVACSGLIGQRQSSEGALGVQWDFWYDSVNHRAEIYSVGNPTTLATSLEIPVLTGFWNDFCSSSTMIGLDIRDYSAGNGTATALVFGCNVTRNWTNNDFGPTAGNGVQFNGNNATSPSGAFTGNTFTDWGVIGLQTFAMMAIGETGGSSTATGNICTINYTSNTAGLGCVDPDINSCFRIISGNLMRYTPATFITGITAFGHYQASTGCTSILISGNQAFNVELCVDMNGLTDGGASPTATATMNYCQNNEPGNTNDGHAIRMYHTTGASLVTISYNVVNGCVAGSNKHAGIALDTAVGKQVYNNTVYGCDDGLYFKNNSTGNKANNNISSNNRRYGINVDGTSTVTTFDYDLFFSNTTANYNGISAGAHDVTSDPKYNNPGSGDFTLQASSPAIKAGTAIGSPYQLALLPSSSWPNGVLTVPQFYLWTIGAFAPPGSAQPSPVFAMNNSILTAQKGKQ